MEDNRTAVIVGAGQAGRWVALTLRAEGFKGRIVMFGDEAHLPYDRPPLSKAVLHGTADLPQLALLTAAKADELRVEWRAVAVSAIDRGARRVRAADGSETGYDWLFLAQGGRARTLPGLAPHPRVATLRSWEDALRIKALIESSRHLLVLGGGWIGLEVAASARQRGCEVTVVEAAPRLCVRTVPACVSAHLQALHERHGVTLRLGQAVQQVEAGEDGVRLRLANGETLRGDALVLGIGLVADDALAAAAGLACDNGVLTDASGRTADPAVFAVGDMANALQGGGRRQRIESWENAQRMAVAAAKAALGVAHDPLAEGAPWFWSDQYDDNLQLLGQPDERLRVVERAVPAKRQRLFFFCEGARVRAVAAVNAGREIKVARKWMLQDRYPDLEALADAGVDLQKLPTTAASA
jgi:3-phenylpropionate/trans-cinnamate dioxygenase ferredoxin reductase subunit